MKKVIKSGLFNLLSFVVIHIILCLIVLLAIGALNLSLGNEGFGWIIGCAVFFLIYFALGFFADFAAIKISKNKKTKIVSLLITFILTSSLLAGLLLCSGLLPDSNNVISYFYLFINTPHMFAYLEGLPAFIFPIGQSLFFVAGMYTHYAAFSAKKE